MPVLNVVKGILIIVKDDRRVPEVVDLLSSELGLPIVFNVGQGILPIPNVERGLAIFNELLGKIDLDVTLVIVVGSGVWNELSKKIPQVDLARLLMRFRVREVG